jgi:sugar (pentulose or hexulose) kinase
VASATGEAAAAAAAAAADFTAAPPAADVFPSTAQVAFQQVTSKPQNSQTYTTNYQP